MQANSSVYVSLKQLKLHNKLIYASKVFDNFVCHLLILHYYGVVIYIYIYINSACKVERLWGWERGTNTLGYMRWSFSTLSWTFAKDKCQLCFRTGTGTHILVISYAESSVLCLASYVGFFSSVKCCVMLVQTGISVCRWLGKSFQSTMKFWVGVF